MAQTYYIDIALCLKIVLLCLCSNPSPRPPDVTPGQSCQSQSESAVKLLAELAALVMEPAFCFRRTTEEQTVVTYWVFGS